VEWISVDDHLPDDAAVIIHAKTMDEDKPLITVAWHESEFGWSLLPECFIPAITHWMPLPEPPKE